MCETVSFIHSRHATQKGYWKDDFVKHFCRSSDRKSPEINRGDDY